MNNRDNQSAVAETNQQLTPRDNRGDFSDDSNERQREERYTDRGNNWRSRQERENEGESYIPDETVEKDYEKDAVVFINSVCEQYYERSKNRYGEGKLDVISAWFDHEGKRMQSEELDKAGEFQKNDEWKKWAKIGLKVAGGLGIVAAATMVGIPVITPILWTIGMRKGWEGVLDAGERLGWGLGRTEMELKSQAELTEKIKKLKKEIQDKKAQNRGLTGAEYFVLANEVIDADAKVAEVQGKNMSAEHSWAVKRAIAASVLTVGTAIFSGIPLGWRDYDHDGIAHQVFWNQNGSQFLYNPGELSQAVASANLHHFPLHYTQAFGDAAHTLGHGLPLLEKGAIFASGWYLYHNYSNAKKKKEEGEGAFDLRVRYHLTRGRGFEAPIVGRRQPETRASQAAAPPIVTKEMTLGDKKELSRKFAMITLARIRSYLELNAPNVAESDAIFNQKTRELIKDIIVHGMGGGDRPLTNHSDNDGEAFKFLLNQAGFDTSQIRYVEQGQFIQCDVIGDTAKRHGLVVEGVDSEHPFGQTLILDHHGDETGNDLSASEVLYESLAASGLLEKTEALDKFIRFITCIDNANHPKLAETFEHSHCTVLGFYREMSAEELYRFFEQGGDETKALTDDEIRAINPRLLQVSENVRRDNLFAKEVIHRGESEGLSLETPYGKAFVDIGGRIRRVEAVFAHGYQIHIKWQPERGRFYISGWPRDKVLAQGIRIRGMWLKPLDDRGPVTIKLGEVIHILTNGQAAPTGKLRQYLEDELSGRRTAQFDRGRRENAPRGRREEGGFRGRRESAPRERRDGGFRHDRRDERRGPRTNSRTARVAA